MSRKMESTEVVHCMLLLARTLSRESKISNAQYEALRNTIELYYLVESKCNFVVKWYMNKFMDASKVLPTNSDKNTSTKEQKK